MHLRPHALLALAALFVTTAIAPGCASQATVIRADGSTARGRLVHADDDIVVLRNATLAAPRTQPAPFTGYRGRPVWVKRELEVAIPRNDIVRLTAVNRRARNVGIAGVVMAGVSLFVLVPSAITYQEAGGDSCSDDFVFGCGWHRTGIGIGSILLIAGSTMAIAGWTAYASSYVDEAGEVVPLAPSATQAGAIRF